MSPTHLEFSAAPLAYLITFNTYGSWLHGDRRGSVDRFHNRYGTPRVAANPLRESYERGLLKHPPDEYSPWADQGSRRNLWTHQEVINAVVYAEYEQGE